MKRTFIFLSTIASIVFISGACSNDDKETPDMDRFMEASCSNSAFDAKEGGECIIMTVDSSFVSQIIVSDMNGVITDKRFVSNPSYFSETDMANYRPEDYPEGFTLFSASQIQLKQMDFHTYHCTVLPCDDDFIIQITLQSLSHPKWMGKTIELHVKNVE